MQTRKYIYRQILMIMALVHVFSFLLTAQTNSNPFEIKPRVGKENINTLKVVKPESNIPDTTRTIEINNLSSDLVPVKDSSIQEKTNLLNPFDVDHVPLKKSLLNANKENLNKQLETTKNSNSFLFWFLFISAALLAIALNIRLQIISLITKSIFNENLLKLFQREESGKNSIGLVLLYIVFCLNAAVFIYLILKEFKGPQGILIYFSIIGIVALMFTFKHIGLWFIGNIFLVSKHTSLYSFAIMNSNLFLGVILLPINLLIAFGPVGLGLIFIYITLGIIVILLCLQFFRGLFIVSEYLIDGIFQIFIYLCAFELIPLIVLVKLLLLS